MRQSIGTSVPFFVMIPVDTVATSPLGPARLI
jgi:hypothetical protein